MTEIEGEAITKDELVESGAFVTFGNGDEEIVASFSADSVDV